MCKVPVWFTIHCSQRCTINSSYRCIINTSYRCTAKSWRQSNSLSKSINMLPNPISCLRKKNIHTRRTTKFLTRISHGLVFFIGIFPLKKFVVVSLNVSHSVSSLKYAGGLFLHPQIPSKVK